jgi:hypothetical protein
VRNNRAVTSSSDLIERADRLRALVDGQPENCAEIVPQLTAMLSPTEEPDVLIAVAAALGAAWNDAASVALLPFVAHPDDRVRLAVTRSLAGGLESPGVKALIGEALIVLTNDPSSDVRDWATFGLGSILDLDTPAVREALRARLWDSDIDTQQEALVGLAERRDPLVLVLLADKLRAERVDRLTVDAARAFADPSLLLPLLALSHRWDLDTELLERAIQACRLGQQEE